MIPHTALLKNLKLQLLDYGVYLGGPKKYDAGKNLLKLFYDSFHNTNILSSYLNHLLIDNYNIDQIWQQIDLINDQNYIQILKFLSQITKQKSRLELFNSDSNYINGDSEVFQPESNNLEEHELYHSQSNDSLAEEHKLNDLDNETNIQENELDDKNKNDMVSLGDANLAKDIIGNKTSFEIQQLKLEKLIGNLEESNVDEKSKSWTLVGEVSAKQRPVNSLLDKPLDYDTSAALSKPKVNKEFTDEIETTITRRIKDKVFDDVTRKRPADRENYTSAAQLALKALETKYKVDHQLSEKNKISLCAVYEQEYLKEKDKNGPSLMLKDASQPSLKEVHENIHRDMRGLFTKLDALCNLRYKAPLPEPEIKILSKTPSSNDQSLMREEITPFVATAQHALVAPQEIIKSNGFETLTEKLKRNIANTQPKALIEITQQQALLAPTSKDDVKRKFPKKNAKKFEKPEKFNFVKQWQNLQTSSKAKQSIATNKTQKAIKNSSNLNSLNSTAHVSTKRIKL